jgi:hypothetical protein
MSVESHAPSADASLERPAMQPPLPRHVLAQLGRRGRAGAADYFYQILIVVIGVFLGITFESMASDRDRTRKAHSAVVQLQQDLERDDADMTRIIAAQQARLRDLSEIAQWLADGRAMESARIDSLLERVTTSPTVYPRRGLYASMMAGGQIALLSEPLGPKIVNLYENIYTRLAANGDHFDYSLERDFFPAYARAWDVSRHAMIAPDLAERVRFRNIVLLMRSWTDYYCNLVVESQVELRSVMTSIRSSGRAAR